jgi:hypothetical protein
MQGGIFDFANAKLTYTQNGVVMGRQSAFQTAGNTSANAPFAMCLGSFAQEGGTFATPGFKGMVGEVRAWFSARTIDQMAASAAYLRLKWRLPW